MLNIGPTEDGSICEIEKCIIEQLGTWIKTNSEAIYNPLPTHVKLHEPDFVLSNYNDYYFLHNIPMEIDPNVSIFKNEKQKIFLDNNKKVQKAIC